MKIAIISDTHDNLVNFKKAVDYLKKENIETVIHCGDVCTPKTLIDALEDFLGKIYITLGNCDELYFREKMIFDGLETKIWPDFGEISLDKKKIAFSHLPQTAENLSKTKKYDLIFYGHSHKPWLENKEKTKIVNPGNLAGLIYKASFAVYDTKEDKLELKVLETIK